MGLLGRFQGRLRGRRAHRSRGRAACAGEKNGFEAGFEFFVIGELFFEDHLAVDEVCGKGVGRHVDEFDSGVRGHVFDVLIGWDEEAHTGTGSYFLAEGDCFFGVG